MGSLLTTVNGAEITLIGSGDIFLDFVAGTVTLPDGTVSNMNKNLNDLGLTQCNSLGVWTSDADSTIFIGSAVTMSDHQLNHVVCNYGFSNVRISIPANSTPDATNQIFFMASTDGWLGYSFPRISHQAGSTTGTSDASNTVYLSKHVGAYNQFLITTENTGGGANSIDLQIEYSEDGTNWYPDQGYLTAVTVAPTAGSNFDSFASEVEHHFYRVRITDTVPASTSTFRIIWNFVNDKGSALL